MAERDHKLQATMAAMDTLDRMVAWATELKRQPLTESLTVHQAGVLHLCIQLGPMSMTELRRHLGSAPSTVSALVDRLEAKGFVRRVDSVSDGRRYDVDATRQGRAHYEDIERRSREFAEALFERWTVDEIEMLRSLGERLLQDARGLSFASDEQVED